MKENNTNTSNTNRMGLERAIEICKQRILIDRRMRENMPIEQYNDYDNFCEKECVAIETLINTIEELNKAPEVNVEFYNPKEHKPFDLDLTYTYK